MKPFVQKGCCLGGGAAFLYALISAVVFGFYNAGTYLIALGGAVLLLYACFGGRLPKKLQRVVNMLWMIALVCVVALLSLMLCAAHGNPPDKANPPQTAVVLGAKVNEGGVPSLMLRRRLLVAVDYLAQNPSAVAVVSGGTGEGESTSESAAMKQFLIAQGVAEQRIYEESASVNTGENLLYTAQLIQKNGLDPHIVLCTDAFHQLRAAILARQNGLSPTALPSRTPPGLVPIYYVREWLGLAKALILKK